MDRSKRVVQAFLNSAEGYFNKKRILEDRSKDPAFRDSPNHAFGKKETYLNPSHISKEDIKCIIEEACQKVDSKLYNIIPFTALNAALQMTIHSYCEGKYQSKIDAKTYQFLMDVLTLKVKERGI